jgi:DNA invertase Pin-like site-specific DNA recombinase
LRQNAQNGLWEAPGPLLSRVPGPLTPTNSGVSTPFKRPDNEAGEAAGAKIQREALRESPSPAEPLSQIGQHRLIQKQTATTKAVAYIRTSSAANVGPEKDSDKRQQQAIIAYAKSARLELVGEFTDAAVSGADHIETRPGFTAMLAYIASNGARTIIVETASRFARDLMVQEVGFAKLQALGIKLVAADSPHSFLDDTPTSKLIRQILGAVSEFDKAMIVAKLKGARERKRIHTGQKVEGRKNHAELHPELVALVRQLRRKKPKGGQQSLRRISAELAARGHFNERGNPFSAASIASMLQIKPNAACA